MEINTFLDKLQSYHSEQVFNPWRDFDTSCDIGPQAPVIRSANLRRYLELRPDAHYLLLPRPWAIRAVISAALLLLRSVFCWDIILMWSRKACWANGITAARVTQVAQC